MSNGTKGNGSGSAQSKYQGAVDAARQKADAKAEASGSAGTEIEVPSRAKAMILKPSAEQIAEMMNDETMEFAPQVHSMEEGELVEGILEGKGPSTTFTQKDPATGQEVTRVVDTWIIASTSGSIRISILSSIQLDKKLPPFVGGFVRIYRGKEQKTQKGFRVTDYMVGGPRRSDGRPRSFVAGQVMDVGGNTIDGQDNLSLPPPATAPATGGEDAQP